MGHHLFMESIYFSIPFSDLLQLCFHQQMMMSLLHLTTGRESPTFVPDHYWLHVIISSTCMNVSLSFSILALRELTEKADCVLPVENQVQYLH